MPARLDWQLGPGEGPALEDDRPEEDPELQERPAPRPVKQVARWPVYVALLAAAAVVGFFLGRWTEARRFVVHGVEDQLALEQLAWREGDRQLYESTLDPWATAEWRSSKVFEFVTAAPLRWEAQIEELVPVEDGHRLQATVTISRPGQAAETTVRFYELRGQRWLRSEP